MSQTIAESPVVTGTRPGRLDLYAGVHKGLRQCMAETLVAVGRMDLFDPTATAETLGAVRALLDLSRTHLHVENQFFHPAMESRRPASARRTANDHADQTRAIERLEAGVLAVERAAAEARRAPVQRLYTDLAAFVAENLSHMAVEETENNAVLWAAYADEELAEIHQAIVAFLGPATLTAFLRWMVPAMSPAERAGLLGGIQLGAPRPVFEAILAAARPHVAERDWAKLMAALAPMPVAA